MLITSCEKTSNDAPSQTWNLPLVNPFTAAVNNDTVYLKVEAYPYSTNNTDWVWAINTYADKSPDVNVRLNMGVAINNTSAPMSSYLSAGAKEQRTLTTVTCKQSDVSSTAELSNMVIGAGSRYKYKFIQK